MATTQEILDRLNAYEPAEPPHECGSECTVPCTAPAVPDIWSEIIHRLPEYDTDNTMTLGFGQEFALRDGTHIVFDGRQQAWVTYEPDPRVDPGWLHL